jgi:hypothetical protein
MNIKRIELVSGNVFYYSPETNESFSFACVINDSTKTFLGGFVCMEADRKLDAFSKLNGTKSSEVQSFPYLKDYTMDNFLQQLGTASPLFVRSLTITVNDYEHCNGTSSKAQSCDERSSYFEVVGMKRVFKSSKSYPVWAMIANHLSIFGAKSFRETFFHGYELDSARKDNVVSVKDTRFSKQNFKAPAAYVRALVNAV